MSEKTPQPVPGKPSRIRGRPRKWKRTVILALPLLAGGAVVNVAVAWGWSLASDYTFIDAREVSREELKRISTFFGRLPSTASEIRENDGLTYFLTTDTEYWEQGWPARAMRGSSDSASNRSLVEFRIIPRPIHRDPDHKRRTVLATAPIFPGFIINTLFYALLLWLLFFAPGSAQRMLRRRRGLCEKCAYPIGVSPVCTECGAAVVRRQET